MKLIGNFHGRGRRLSCRKLAVMAGGRGNLRVSLIPEHTTSMGFDNDYRIAGNFGKH